MKRPYPNRGGFTLIELLVVMTIIAVLTGMGMGVMGAARGRSAVVKCTNNLRQLSSAALMYSADNNQAFPFVEDGYVQNFRWPELIRGYGLSNEKGQLSGVFRCPNRALSGAAPLNASTGTPSGNPADFANFLWTTVDYTPILRAAGEPIPKKLTDFGSKRAFLVEGNSCEGLYYATGNTTRCLELVSYPSLKRHNGSVNAVFWDGHVETIKPVGNGSTAVSTDLWKRLGGS